MRERGRENLKKKRSFSILRLVNTFEYLDYIFLYYKDRLDCTTSHLITLAKNK